MLIINIWNEQLWIFIQVAVDETWRLQNRLSYTCGTIVSENETVRLVDFAFSEEFLSSCQTFFSLIDVALENTVEELHDQKNPYDLIWFMTCFCQCLALRKTFLS